MAKQKMQWKDIFSLLKDTFSEWSEDNATRLAASLSYYTVFSLVPLLVVVIALAGVIGRGTAVHDEILNQMQHLVGDEGRGFIGDLLVTAAYRPDTGKLAAVIGGITLLFGALGVFGALQDALNTIWEVRLKDTQGFGEAIKRFVLGRLLSFTMVLGIGFMLLVSLVVNALLAFMNAYVNNIYALPEVIMNVLNLIVSYLVITLMFALMFKILPDAETSWHDASLGAAVTAFLFTIGKVAIATYLGRSSVGTSYGAAGSLVLILIWVYYSAQILFLGAEFTQVYANKFGDGVRPGKNAIMMTEMERAKQGMPRNPDIVNRQTYQPAVSEEKKLVAAALAGAPRSSTQPEKAYTFVRTGSDWEQASIERDDDLVKDVAAPLALSWLGALVVGTLIHFMRGRK